MYAYQSIQQSLVVLWRSAVLQVPKQGLFLPSTVFSIWPFTQLAFLLSTVLSNFHRHAVAFGESQSPSCRFEYQKPLVELLSSLDNAGA